MGKFEDKSSRLDFVIGDSLATIMQRWAAWIPVRFWKVKFVRQRFIELFARWMIVVCNVKNARERQSGYRSLLP